MRLSRSINQKRSNAMLVGVGGSGKQSVTKMATFIGRHTQCFQIELSKGYGNKDFLEDFKKCWLGTSA